MDVKNKVLSYINSHNLIVRGDSLICAVSGGADSVCMLDIITELKEELSLKIYVAHLNHGLRGDEAVRDELFVKDLCKKYDVPFYSKTVDVKELSKKLKISCEEAGRIARYDFFNELKETLGAVKVLTAHNKNDNVETVIMRLLRGTDFIGLSGISPYNENCVVRPILCLSRDEIESYLMCKGLDFVTDSTNLENDFTRNKIRNTLIPSVIKDYNSNFIDTFSSSIDLFCEGNNFIENYVESRFAELAFFEKYGLKFSLPTLLKEDTYVVKRLIKKAVEKLDNSSITSNLCAVIYKNLENDGITTINKNLTLYVQYNTAYFLKSKETVEYSYHLDKFGTYHIPEISADLEVSEFYGKPDFSDKNITYFSCDYVNCDFLLRKRLRGDRINLLNCGNKKLSDLLIDEKIPSFLRDEIPVLEYNGEIIWVCGMRDNPSFRKNEEGKYIKISLHKEN